MLCDIQKFWALVMLICKTPKRAPDMVDAVFDEPSDRTNKL